MSSGLPVSPDTIHDEIKSARQILARWKTRILHIPSVDVPGSEDEMVQFIRELTGELLVVANKTNGLSMILSERLLK